MKFEISNTQEKLMKEMKKNTELNDDLDFSEKKLKVAVKKVIEIDN